MSRVVFPDPVLRLVSYLVSDRELVGPVEAGLVQVFGPIAMASPEYPFDLSDYYRDEMGPGIVRRWLCFERLFGADELVESRISTGEIESGFTTDGKRTVNIDPGYLDYGKLVLASLKQAPDKIYLGRGVWAHTCLRYRFGSFVAPDHSFPDFKSGCFNDFMISARGLYRRLLRKWRRSSI